jgi:OCT family organic cation transporter-like MFS transporter 4/5
MFKSSASVQGGAPSIDRLLEKVGSAHTYQLLSFLLFWFEWMIAGFILLGQNFYFLRGELACPGIPGPEECRVYVCGLPSEQWLSFLKEDVNSIVYDLSPPLMCDREWHISAMQSMVYFGSLIGFFIFPTVADNYGRKISLIWAWGACFVGCLLFVFNGNRESTIILGLFLQGLGSNPGITLHFSFLTEQVAGKARQMMCAALQIAFSLSSILISVIFYYSRNWFWNSIFLLCLPMLVTSVLNCLLVESPKFTIKRNKDRTLRILNRIARINGRQEISSEMVQEISEAEEMVDRYSPVDMIRFKSLRLDAFLTSFIFFAVQLIYYGVIFILYDVGLSIY